MDKNILIYIVIFGGGFYFYIVMFVWISGILYYLELESLE